MIVVSTLLFALLLGSFIFVILPRHDNWQRLASATMFVVLLAIVYSGSVEMLGRPKPLRVEWRDPHAAKVLGASISEGKAIYVWLQFGDSDEPRAYALPWNTHMAEQIETAMRQAQASGRPLEASHPLGSPNSTQNDEGKPVFYARPQPPAPPKAYGGSTASLESRLP